jgi:16S rRNA (uracil1498-N3)-methyltransferase
MSHFRCFAPDLDCDKEQITLSPFESHHLLVTNRARKGAEVIVFNGSGLEWDAILSTSDRRRTVLSKNRIRILEKPKQEITLVIAIIKGKTFDAIMRQATELGVSFIQPLLTTWTQVQVKKGPAKMDKWTQDLIEGCKQSGNPWLPSLMEPVTLEDYLATNDLESAVVASLEKNTKSWSELSLSNRSTLLVGPEGDFTPEEYQLLLKNGAEPVSLGPYVLRSETAVVSAISQLSQKLLSPCS